MSIEERKLEIYPSAEVLGNEEGENSNKETNQEAVEEKAPDDWMTGWALGEELGADSRTIKGIAEELVKGAYGANSEFDSTEWVGSYKKPPGERPLVYYSPDLIELIKEAYGEYAPDDWMTVTALAEKLGAGSRTIERIKNSLSEANPVKEEEWAKKLKDSGGRKHLYYSPKLIELIKEAYEKFPRAPADWKTRGQIEKELDINYKVIEKIKDSLLKANPALGEWVGSYKNLLEGKPLVHYSPKLIELIRKEDEKIPRAPKGWKTRRAIGEELGVVGRTIKPLIDSLLEANQWVGEFGEYRNLRYYSPELIELIKEAYGEYAPDGWMTRKELAEKLRVDWRIIEHIKNSLLEANPDKEEEWFQELRDSGGRKYWHYSPDIVNLITKESEFRGNIRSDQGRIFQYAVEIALKSIGNKNLKIEGKERMEEGNILIPDFIRLATGLPEGYKTFIVDAKLQSTTDSIKGSLKKYSQIIKKEDLGKGYMLFIYLSGAEVTLSQCRDDEEELRNPKQKEDEEKVEGVDVTVRYYPVLKLLEHFLREGGETSAVAGSIQRLLTGNAEPLSPDQRERIQEIYDALSYLKELVDKNQFSKDQEEQTREELLKKYSDVREKMIYIARNATTEEIFKTNFKALINFEK